MFRFKVIYRDGVEEEADCGPLAQVEFERTYKMLFTEAFDTDQDPPRARLEYQYFLTWASLKHDGKDVGDNFDEWLKRVKDGGLVLTDDQVKKAKRANPTRRAQSRGASSR
jgi:hypothetical protein